ncbi:MAG TPA: hypothetical protein VGI81_10595, partial [Tepidisphaeraceae bacterium]
MHPRPVLRFARISAALLLALAGCASLPSPRDNLIAEVDAACGGPAWRCRNALRGEVTVRRAGRPDLNGVMTYDVRGNRLVLEFPAAAGCLTSFGFDGHGVWIDCPSTFDGADWPAVLQWASWVAVPYRLTDPSIRAREVQPTRLAGVTCRVAELERPADGPGACALY